MSCTPLILVFFGVIGGLGVWGGGRGEIALASDSPMLSFIFHV